MNNHVETKHFTIRKGQYKKKRLAKKLALFNFFGVIDLFKKNDGKNASIRNFFQKQ